MPQITVDYSAELTDDFDRPGFARALHASTVEIVDASPAACKTRFRRTEDTVVGQDGEGHVIVHVGVGLLAGRTDEAKARLTETALELLRQYVKPAEGLTLHASAMVSDLDPSYRSAKTA
ncbi:5-carboxymethyl-2-hydroxymuconate Delta-isomerase [Streptomyces sp. NPDC018610]|uniref:5-carboxymethyl-2-hydroxymuconate Delta-isomerase n=1 Tax=Streptomyces sp. NPDC018610 TaxID=3365049 RepID=UPI003796DEEA